MSLIKLATAAVTALVFAPGALAQQPVKVRGTYVGKPFAFELPGLKGATGAPVAPTAAEFVVRGGGIYDGVRGVYSGMVDMYGHVWLQNGVATHEKDGSRYINRWNGHCVNGNAGGKPIVMCGGDWYTLPGATGIYAGIVASGTWKGTVNAEGQFEAEWDGMYTK